MTVPLALLPALDPGVLEHTIPGWQAEKIALLLHSLPTVLKKPLGSVPEAARLFASTIVPFAEPLLVALGRAVFELSGARVPDEVRRARRGGYGRLSSTLDALTSATPQRRASRGVAQTIIPIPISTTSR